MVWVDKTSTGLFRRPRPSSPCSASGMADFQAVSGKSLKKGKLGSVSLNLLQNSCKVSPNSTALSRSFPPRKLCPPLDKLHLTQSEGFRTGYCTKDAGFFREVRHIVPTLDTATSKCFLPLRITPCKFREMFLSNLDFPHRDKVLIQESYIPRFML